MNNDQLTAPQKIFKSVKTLKDWYKIPLDKLGIFSTITYTSRSGIEATCRTKSTDVNEIIVCLSGHEYPKKYLKVQNDAVIFDLGANIGGFGLYFDSVNKNVRYKGYAFEPFSGNMNLLKHNYELNHITKFKTYEAAISDINGTVKFNDNVSYDAMHISGNNKGINVESHTLSTFCKQNKISIIDLLKMDIEGGEYAILKHDITFIKKYVRTIIMEYHELNNNTPADWSKIFPLSTHDIQDIHRGLTNGVICIYNKKLLLGGI